MATTPIADYALLGDCHGAALVSAGGSVDWWCPARFDAPSAFARILDEDAGHWEIRPRGASTASRCYVDETMVVRTDFTAPAGRLRLTDALALGAQERGHEIGTASPHLLVRHLEVLEGEVDVDLVLALRPQYGLLRPQLVPVPGGVEARGGAEAFLLTGDRPLHVEGDRVAASFRMRAGEEALFALRHRSADDDAGAPRPGRDVVEDTLAGWRSWSELHHSYQGPYLGAVRRSALVLQALTHQPTGAVVAAPTTSLPETPGGGDNWDYRFSWLRDGSFTLQALWTAACPDEAHRFFDWITASVGRIGDGPVPVVLGVLGEHDLSEHELGHLSGYGGSTPVRVGNDAWEQSQLDVLGEVLDCAWWLREQLGELSPDVAELLRSLADRAADTWEEPDAGIWEGRQAPRHYVTSKVMCWVALDRAIRMAERLGAADRVARWEEARAQVRAAVLERGWNASVRAFTGAFGSDHLDAGVLLVPIVGFLPADDPRVLATLDAVEEQLGTGALVQRWTGAGDEGAFVICSYWLATCRALAGQVDRAREIFEEVTAHANDVGLLSEEVDLRSGDLLGNFPQALSHIGLVNAAWAIAQAEGGTAEGGAGSG